MNCLYPTIMAVREYYELLPKEVENFFPENTPTDGNYFYTLRIDYYIPDDLKRATGDLPIRPFDV